MNALKVLAMLAVLLVSPATSAAIIILDPVGDHTGTVDVTGLRLDIAGDGSYSLRITADSANPFIGAFRININLFNLSLDEYFQSGFNDDNLSLPQEEVVLTGTDPELTDWQDDHTIATSTYDGLGNPPGVSLFRTSVADLPFESICVSEDIIGLDGCGTAIAEPSSLALGSLALVLLALAIRRWQPVAA